MIGLRDPHEEGSLEFPRQKPLVRLFPLGYVAVRLLRFLTSDQTTLRMLLNVHFVLKRLAWEVGLVCFPETLHLRTTGLREETLREVLASCSSVVDIGCGTGRWCRIAAKYVTRVVGIDRDREQLARATRITKDVHVEYREQDLGFIDLPGLAEMFDVAMLIHVLEHVDDPLGLLSSLARRAHTLVVEVPDFEGDPMNPVRKSLGCPYWSDADHVREYTVHDLRRQLQDAGWRTELMEQRGSSIVAVARATSAPNTI